MEQHLDSITVGHKLVEDVQLLMSCFNFISKEECFQPARIVEQSQPETTKSSKKKAKEGRNVFQDFPEWFSNMKNCTIYQWIAAYFEFLISRRYTSLLNL